MSSLLLFNRVIDWRNRQSCWYLFGPCAKGVRSEYESNARQRDGNEYLKS